MLNLFQWGVSATLLILVVLAVRSQLSSRLSPKARYALWLVVLLRLIVPFQMPVLTLPVSELAEEEISQGDGERMVYAFPTEFYPESTKAPGEKPVIDRTLHQQMGGPEYYSGGVVIDQEGATHYFFMMPVDELVLGWAAGTVAVLTVLLWSNLRFRKVLLERRIPIVVENYPLPVYAAEGIPSPCLFGLWKPAVYLTPESAGEGAARAHILAHELTHYRHKDHIWSWLRCLALALHWYNPLVWLAVKLSKEDGELACDQGAVERLGEEERIPYGRTLVDLVARRSPRPGDLLSCSTTMTGGKKTIQTRLSLLVKHPGTKKVAALAAVLVLAVSAAVMFAGRGEQPETAYEKLQRQITGLSSFYYYPPPFSSLSSTGVVDSALVNQARELLARGQETEYEPQIDARQTFYPGVHLISSHIDGIENYLIVSGNDGKSYLLTNAAHASFVGEGVREADTFLTMMPEDIETGNYEVAAGYDFDLALELEKLALKQIGLEEPPILRGELLDQEEIDHFWTSFFHTDNRRDGLMIDGFYMTNQFLTSWYDSPQDIDLFELFYNGTKGGEGLTDEEYQIVTGGIEPECACHKVTTGEMEAVLKEFTGLSLDETNKKRLGSFNTYLPEYDAYYHFHGDLNYCELRYIYGGLRLGDQITLYYNGGYGDGAVTLRDTGDGYHFLSNRPATNYPLYQATDPAQVENMARMLWESRDEAYGSRTWEQVDEGGARLHELTSLDFYRIRINDTMASGIDLGWRVILNHGGGYYLDLYYPGGLDGQLMELVQTLPQI